MTHKEIGNKLVQLGISPFEADTAFAQRHSILTKFCDEVSGDGITLATGIGAQFNPPPEMSVADMAKAVGCTVKEMREYIRGNE